MARVMISNDGGGAQTKSAGSAGSSYPQGKIPSNIFAGLAPASSSPYAEPIAISPPTWGNTPAPVQQATQTPYNPPAPAAPAAPAAPPPPAPPQGGKTWYQGLDAGSRAAQDQQWLGGDSDYTAQISEYDKALQSFIDRIAGQKKMYNQDATDATASTGRNQAMSLDNLGEDFGARGLAYSGLFDQTKNQTNDRFNEAKGGIEKVRTRNLTDASNREADYRSENQISRGNAERASLARQAQRQALLDSMAGF